MDVTVIMPVSRDTFLQRIFAQLDMMTFDPETTNLLVYVDGDMQLFEKARNFTVNSRFKERLCIFRRKGLPNVGSIRGRRRRIAEIHNEVKEIVKRAEYIFLIEDDTLMPLNALQILLNNYSAYPFAGFVSGVELGRWGYTHIGAWKTDDVYNTKRIMSVPDEVGISEVDAAGFYCCLTKAENYLGHYFEPFEDTLGPDVNFGFKLRQAGFQNYIDYTLKCKHLTKRGDINFVNSDIIQVQFTKENDKWDMMELKHD